MTDLGGHVTAYAYDAAGRQASSTITAPGTAPGGTSTTVSFQYWNTGQLATNTGPAGTATYAYDVAGNRVTEYLQNFGVSIKHATASFDALGRLVAWADSGSTTAPAAMIAYGYDADGNVRSTAATFYALGQTGAAATQTSTTQWFRYDSMNRLVTDKATLSGTAGGAGTTVVRGAAGTDILYDAAGRRTSVTLSATLRAVVENPARFDDPYPAARRRPAPAPLYHRQLHRGPPRGL